MNKTEPLCCLRWYEVSAKLGSQRHACGPRRQKPPDFGSRTLDFGPVTVIAKARSQLSPQGCIKLPIRTKSGRDVSPKCPSLGWCEHLNEASPPPQAPSFMRSWLSPARPFFLLTTRVVTCYLSW